ncbi:MAG: hypothetical protein HY016_05225 [Nitrosomonadales bacterium]|nr:hypothetical protein [Nitrosomonadales bacterium]
MLVFLSAWAPASADQFDTVNYIAGAGWSYDDNVFRLPADADPQLYLGQPSKSDVTRSVSLGINIDKKYSNQEIIVNALGTDIKYRNFANLDYASSSLKGAWNARFTSRLNTALSVSRAQTLINPADSRLYTRNLSTNDNAGLNGDGYLGGNWHVLFGASAGKTSSTINDINFLSSRTKANEGGIKYDPADGKSVTLLVHNLRVSNPDAQPNPWLLMDTGYTEKQLELRATWQINGKSGLSGSLQKNDHRNFNYSQRDYHGNQGNLSYMLSVSEKTFLNVSLQRSLNSWLTLYSSYFVADSVVVTPSWQVSARTSVHMSINRTRNDYLGPLIPDMILRSDVIRSTQLGIDWTPQRAITISATVQHSKRTSTPDAYSSFGYDDNTASLSVQANF